MARSFAKICCKITRICSARQELPDAGLCRSRCARFWEKELDVEEERLKSRLLRNFEYWLRDIAWESYRDGTDRVKRI